MWVLAVIEVRLECFIWLTPRYLRGLFNDYGDNFDAMSDFESINSMNIL